MNNQTNNQPKPSHTWLQVIAIGGIIILLVFLSIGVVRLIPQVLGGLASASLSLGSIFPAPGPQATSTGSASNYYGPSGTSTANGRGFIVATSSTPVSAWPANAQSTQTNAGQNTGGYVNTNSYPTTSYGSQAPGTPDLAVSVISQGIIDPTTGNYVPASSVGTGDTVFVKFRVQNVGTAASGAWSLKVTMPSTDPADRSRQTTGNSLPAGSSVTGEARFDAPAYGSGQVVITADRLNTVRELNENNNTAIANFTVGNYTTTNNNGGYDNGGGYYNAAGPIGTVPTVSVAPDLTPRVTEIGILDSNNNFISVPQGSLYNYERIAIKFSVINQGQQATGPWYLRADLNGGGTVYNSGSYYNNGYGNYNNGYYNSMYNGNTYGAQTYISPVAEASIPGGTSYTYFIGFSNLSTGNNTVTITLDSQNNVSESNEGNNSQTVSFYVGN